MRPAQEKVYRAKLKEIEMARKKVLIAPSILSADFSRMREEIERIKNADMIHCDVMDGMFVPNLSFGPKMVADIRPHTRLPLDVHLMIEKPQRYIEAFAEAGADFITVHYEACGEELSNVLDAIRRLGKKSGAVINPKTPVSVLQKSLSRCDIILLMSVNPGFGGQSFIDPVLDKLREARKMIDDSGLDILLEIDGGINAKYAPLAVEAGADVLVAGNYLFTSDDIDATMESMRKHAGAA
jgi:ribulose-phosphate 3-epimerase